MKKEDVSTINDSVYYESDEKLDTIIDSNKKVDPRNNSIAETKIVDRVCNLSVGVRIFNPAVVIEGCIRPVISFPGEFAHGAPSRHLVSSQHKLVEGVYDWLGMQECGG